MARNDTINVTAAEWTQITNANASAIRVQNLSNCIMRGRIKQTCHILYEVGYFLASLVSRVYNAINGGSMHQTYSARVHIEARDAREGVARGLLNNAGMEWVRREKRINAVFFWEADHCEKAWTSEVSRARKTLARNGEYPLADV